MKSHPSAAGHQPVRSQPGRLYAFLVIALATFVIGLTFGPWERTAANQLNSRIDGHRPLPGLAQDSVAGTGGRCHGARSGWSLVNRTRYVEDIGIVLPAFEAGRGSDRLARRRRTLPLRHESTVISIVSVDPVSGRIDFDGSGDAIISRGRHDTDFREGICEEPVLGLFRNGPRLANRNRQRAKSQTAVQLRDNFGSLRQRWHTGPYSDRTSSRVIP